METYNAKIKSADFGYCEHGFLTFEIWLDAPSGKYYRFADYALDEPVIRNGKRERIPTQEGFKCLTAIMQTVGVSHWNELKGKYVRIKVDEQNSMFCNISVIGNLMEEKWFNIEAFWEQVKIETAGGEGNGNHDKRYRKRNR